MFVHITWEIFVIPNKRVICASGRLKDIYCSFSIGVNTLKHFKLVLVTEYLNFPNGKEQGYNYT